MHSPLVGVLSLQGDVREHEAALAHEGAEVRRVRRPEELASLDAIVIPGGESTAIELLARGAGLFEPLRGLIAEGLPAFGTCAGMVLLAERLQGAKAGQETLGGISMTVRRNGFGRQVDSFEEELRCVGLDAPVRGVFIRAPWVVEVGVGVEVLARSGVGGVVPPEQVDDGAPGAAADLATTDTASERGKDGRIVAVRQGVLMATSFHPEVGGDSRLHRLFLDRVRRA